MRKETQSKLWESILYWTNQSFVKNCFRSFISAFLYLHTFPQLYFFSYWGYWDYLGIVHAEEGENDIDEKLLRTRTILMTTKKKLLLVRLHGTGDAHLFPQLICCIQMNFQRTMLDGIGNSTSQDPGLLHAKLSVTQSTNLNIIFLPRMRCTGSFTSMKVNLCPWSDPTPIWTSPAPPWWTRRRRPCMAPTGSPRCTDIPTSRRTRRRRPR